MGVVGSGAPRSLFERLLVAGSTLEGGQACGPPAPPAPAPARHGQRRRCTYKPAEHEGTQAPRLGLAVHGSSLWCPGTGFILSPG